jgi:hypothetical protein
MLIACQGEAVLFGGLIRFFEVGKKGSLRLSSNTGLDFLVKSLENADVADKWIFGVIMH